MAKIEIVKYGDPILRNKTKPIDKITKEIKQLANDMLETMYKSCGAGLAGPQVGSLLKICVIDVMPNGKRSPLVLINPAIVNGDNKIDMEEGCLSIPGIAGIVSRPVAIEIRGFNEKGEKVKMIFDGVFARICQHEYDHLQGILFIDRANKIYKTDRNVE